MKARNYYSFLALLLWTSTCGPANSLLEATPITQAVFTNTIPSTSQEGLVIAPTLHSTATPPVPVSTLPTAAVQIISTAQVGGWMLYYLHFDTAQWEAVPLGKDEQGNDVQALRHRSIEGCTIAQHGGSGISDNWSVSRDDRKIGASKIVRMGYADKNTGRWLFFVYDFALPFPQGTFQIAVDVSEVRENQLNCVEEAERVFELTQSTP